MKKYLPLLFLIFACTDSKDTYVKRINKLNEAVKEVTDFSNNETVNELIENYEAFTNKFPNDELTPSYLFKLAEFYGATSETEKELKTFETITTNYPDYEKAPQALFMQAFTLENKLNNLPEAEKLYKQFLKNYPNHEFADDAKFSIENLYLSDEELLEKFMKANAVDSLGS